jgi:hypothetical protein
VVVEFWGFMLIVVDAVSEVVEFWGFKVVIPAVVVFVVVVVVVVVVAVVVVEEMTDEVEIWEGEIVEVLVADVDWSESMKILMEKSLFQDNVATWVLKILVKMNNFENTIK